MQAPTAAELLGVWERGWARGPTHRGDALLALALPDEPTAELPIGERDARLLELRALLFGSELEGAADCPSCGDPVEFALSTETLLAERDRAADDGRLGLSAFGYDVRFRLPTAADLVAAAAAADVDAGRARLLERCVLSASADARHHAPAELPAPVVAAVAERMAAADPLADVRLALECPGCGGAWTVAFDVAAWLWSEVESWARRTVLDVHTLASAYGWSESAILALGPRRELYLDLVGR